jgi:hypothetical protein
MLSRPGKPHGLLHEILVEYGIVLGILFLVNLVFPFPLSLPIVIVLLAMVALYRRKRAMRRAGILVTNRNGRFVLNVLAHYSLLLLAFLVIGLLIPFPLSLLTEMVVLVLFVRRFRKKFSVV